MASYGTFWFKVEYTETSSDMNEQSKSLFHLGRPAELRVSFLAIGGAITAIETPDRDGRNANVVLAFADLAAYATQKVFLGTVAGRYANRIAGARFTLDGRVYSLAATDGTSAVHGGWRGFDKAIWRVEHGPDRGADCAVLEHRSPDGDEGYPGALSVRMTYRVEGLELSIAYEARTDKPTLVNLTNHSYFNLAGVGDCLGHVLEIPADRYTPSDAELIPTGEIAPVEGTPFDFRQPRTIGERIRDPHPQMLAGHGYDVNYVVGGTSASPPVRAAHVVEPLSGRTMTIETTAPGMQFYSGNLLDGTIVGASGRTYRQSDGFCLEPHHFPDTPNKPHFPSARLDPGDIWRSLTRYRFGVEP